MREWEMMVIWRRARVQYGSCGVLLFFWHFGIFGILAMEGVGAWRCGFDCLLAWRLGRGGEEL